MEKRFCNNCGAELAEGIQFCTSCGVKVMQSSTANPQPVIQQTVNQPYVAEPAPGRMNTEYVPDSNSKYEPITTGGYIGIMLLMCIPFVGIILAIIWACGGCRKINKRNLARATLIMMIIGTILSLIISFALRGLVKKTSTIFLGSAGISSEDTSDSDSSLNFITKLMDTDNTNEESAENTDKIDKLMEKAMEKAISDYSEEEQDSKSTPSSGKWPKILPKYPTTDFAQVEDYRIEIYNTTKDEMLDYIKVLQKDGYEYEDFLEFGFSEQDMLDMNGWWATDGKLYIGISYSEGMVILDFMDEKPTFDNLLEMME